MTNIFTFLGLFLTTAGTFLLAYDVLRGPVRWYKEDGLAGRLETIEHFRRSVREDFRRLAEAGTPNAEDQSHVVEQNYDELRRISVAKCGRDSLLERRTAARLAATGLVRVFFGSAMQAVPAGCQMWSGLVGTRRHSKDSAVLTTRREGSPTWDAAEQGVGRSVACGARPQVNAVAFGRRS
jgi:hypothetical protein